jgi:hypothetical protein
LNRLSSYKTSERGGFSRDGSRNLRQGIGMGPSHDLQHSRSNPLTVGFTGSRNKPRRSFDGSRQGKASQSGLNLSPLGCIRGIGSLHQGTSPRHEQSHHRQTSKFGFHIIKGTLFLPFLFFIKALKISLSMSILNLFKNKFTAFS